MLTSRMQTTQRNVLFLWVICFALCGTWISSASVEAHEGCAAALSKADKLDKKWRKTLKAFLDARKKASKGIKKYGKKGRGFVRLSCNASRCKNMILRVSNDPQYSQRRFLPHCRRRPQTSRRPFFPWLAPRGQESHPPQRRYFFVHGNIKNRRVLRGGGEDRSPI